MDYQSPAPRRNPARKAKVAAKTPLSTTGLGRLKARQCRPEDLEVNKAIEEEAPKEAIEIRDFALPSEDKQQESIMLASNTGKEWEKQLLLSKAAAISSSSSSSLKNESEGATLKIFLRIRPVQKKSVAPAAPSRPKRRLRVVEDEPQHVCLVAKDEHSVVLAPPPSSMESKRTKTEIFKGFSRVLLPESSQEDVYEHVMNPVLKEFMDGKSCLVVAMGPTSSGKTYTMFGNMKEPGLIPRALRKLLVIDSDEVVYESRSYFISMLEIYSERGRGEKIFDLFQDGLELSLQQSTIKGLQEVCISSVEEAEYILSQGMEKRMTASTNVNNQSSRSQCIINIRSDNQMPDDDGGNGKSGEAVLTIVDLAGAEREKRTGNQGIRFNESNFINNTSMVFGQCLRALLEHQKSPKKPLQKHYHSSLLTRYLKDYMEGKGRMVMVLNVSSGEENYVDTSIVLRQASPYADIKFNTTEEIPNVLRTKRTSNALTKNYTAKRRKLHHTNNDAMVGKKAFEDTLIDGSSREGAYTKGRILSGRNKSDDLSDQLEGKKNSSNCSIVLTLTQEELDHRISLAVDSALQEKENIEKDRWMTIYSEVLGDVKGKHEETVKVLQEQLCSQKEQLKLEKEHSLVLSNELDILKNYCRHLEMKIQKLKSTDCMNHNNGETISGCLQNDGEDIVNLHTTSKLNIENESFATLDRNPTNTDRNPNGTIFIDDSKYNDLNYGIADGLERRCVGTDAEVNLKLCFDPVHDLPSNSNACKEICEMVYEKGKKIIDEDLLGTSKEHLSDEREEGCQGGPENRRSIDDVDEQDTAAKQLDGSDVDECQMNEEDLETVSSTAKQICKSITETAEKFIVSDNESFKVNEKSSEDLSDTDKQDVEGNPKNSLRGDKSKLKKGKMLASLLANGKKNNVKFNSDLGNAEEIMESTDASEDFGPISECLQDLLGVPVVEIENAVWNKKIEVKKQILNMIAKQHDSYNYSGLEKDSQQQCLCLRYCFWVLVELLDESRQADSALVIEKQNARQKLFSDILRAKSVRKAAFLAREGLTLEGLSEHLEPVESCKQQSEISADGSIQGHSMAAQDNKENVDPQSAKIRRRKLLPASTLLLNTIDDPEIPKNTHRSETEVVGDRQMGTKGRMLLAKMLADNL